MDDICDQIPNTLAPFHGYHRVCYQRFTGNLGRLVRPQATIPQDPSEPRLSMRGSINKDHIIFQPDCIFCNREGRKRVNKGEVSSHEGLSKFDFGGGKKVQEVAEKKQFIFMQSAISRVLSHPVFADSREVEKQK
jgi:hypothetical protein